MHPDSDSRWGIQVALGLILTLVGRIAIWCAPQIEGSAKGLLVVPGTLLIAVGLVFWYWGCGTYALRKGYSAVLAALGVLGPLGIVILAMLPDKSITAQTSEETLEEQEKLKAA